MNHYPTSHLVHLHCKDAIDLLEGIGDDASAMATRCVGKAKRYPAQRLDLLRMLRCEPAMVQDKFGCKNRTRIC
jgi:hypothetical protein